MHVSSQQKIADISQHRISGMIQTTYCGQGGKIIWKRVKKL